MFLVLYCAGAEVGVGKMGLEGKIFNFVFSMMFLKMIENYVYNPK